MPEDVLGLGVDVQDVNTMQMTLRTIPDPGCHTRHRTRGKQARCNT